MGERNPGLSLEDAAHSIGIHASEALSAAGKLEALERGQKFPTRNQLAKIASVYRRPLITFYLRQPPPQASRGEDFSTLPFDVPPRENAKLDGLLRGIRARQEMVKSLLEDEEAPRLDFVASATMRDGVHYVVESIAAKLDFRLDARRNGTADDLFKELRNRAEHVGVFVLLDQRCERQSRAKIRPGNGRFVPSARPETLLLPQSLPRRS